MPRGYPKTAQEKLAVSVRVGSSQIVKNFAEEDPTQIQTIPSELFGRRKKYEKSKNEFVNVAKIAGKTEKVEIGDLPKGVCFEDVERISLYDYRQRRSVEVSKELVFTESGEEISRRNLTRRERRKKHPKVYVIKNTLTRVYLDRLPKGIEVEDLITMKESTFYSKQAKERAKHASVWVHKDSLEKVDPENLSANISPEDIMEVNQKSLEMLKDKIKATSIVFSTNAVGEIEATTYGAAKTKKYRENNAAKAVLVNWETLETLKSSAVTEEVRKNANIRLLSKQQLENEKNKRRQAQKVWYDPKTLEKIENPEKLSFEEKAKLKEVTRNSYSRIKSKAKKRSLSDQEIKTEEPLASKRPRTSSLFGHAYAQFDNDISNNKINDVSNIEVDEEETIMSGSIFDPETPKLTENTLQI